MARETKQKSNRLQGYDYSMPGAYFVTLVAAKRKPLFGGLVDEEVHQSVTGEIVREEWLKTGQMRPEIRLDEFVIMPDHFHAILFLNEDSANKRHVAAHRGAQLRRDPSSLGAIIAGFKSKASQRAEQSLWQRNYYDRIIRDQDELDRIREYIRYNPLMLSERKFFDELSK